MTVQVAFLVDSPSRRSHGNSVSRLALGLAETRRVETTLVCYSADPRPPWLPSDVRIHRLGVDRVSHSLPSLVRYLRTQKPDVLITRQVHANFVALAASSIARVPPRWPGNIVVVHDHLIALSHASNWRDNKWVAKVAYRFANALISPSPTIREDIIKWCGLDPASIGLVPPPIPKFSGISGPPPHAWLEADGPPVFVNTSNLMPWKRVDLLIDAFDDLRQRHDARLLIVGDGPERSHAAEKIQQLGLSALAETVGWVEDPMQFAARAWAFVLPSDEEGYAQVLTEAMSAGCPVITADAQGGGPRFVTDEGKYGLLVPRNDQAKLTEAMEHILKPDVRAQYSDLGLQRADELSPAKSANRLVDFLSSRFGLNV
jgi:glycosyltransferase involved in cell wall biosynthesis